MFTKNIVNTTGKFNRNYSFDNIVNERLRNKWRMEFYMDRDYQARNFDLDYLLGLHPENMIMCPNWSGECYVEHMATCSTVWLITDMVNERFPEFEIPSYRDWLIESREEDAYQEKYEREFGSIPNDLAERLVREEANYDMRDERDGPEAEEAEEDEDPIWDEETYYFDYWKMGSFFDVYLEEERHKIEDATEEDEERFLGRKRYRE